MKKTAFDDDNVLNDFLTDYVDKKLNRAEKRSFEEYLSENEKERVFAAKVIEGKRALSKLAKYGKGIHVRV